MASLQYREFTFEIREDLVDRVSGALWEVGTLGLEVDDSRGTSRVVVKAYFQQPADLTLIAQTLEAVDREITIHDRILTDEDWPDTWKQYFTGGCVGRSFIVVPPWNLRSAATCRRRTRIVIEPGAAFGTGQHTTTALCLERLEAAPPRGLDCLDVGTGSGILAIAAARLGARSVIALDCDPEVIGNFSKNMALNGLHGQVPLIVGTPECLGGLSVDLVLANIDLNTIDSLAPRLSSLVSKRNGRLILSGFLDNDAMRVCRMCQGSPETVCRTHVRDGWGSVDVRVSA